MLLSVAGHRKQYSFMSNRIRINRLTSLKIFQGKKCRQQYTLLDETKNRATILPVFELNICEENSIWF